MKRLHLKCGKNDLEILISGGPPFPLLISHIPCAGYATIRISKLILPRALFGVHLPEFIVPNFCLGNKTLYFLSKP